MIYFTSDLHLGHEAVIRKQNRPFANADEMNRMLIENYNSVVHKNDTEVVPGVREIEHINTEKGLSQ